MDPIDLGSHAASGGSIVAIASIESYDEQDLNGDGDTRDRILTLYDIRTGESTNTGVGITGQLVTDGSTVVFLYSEREDFIDRNGDNDRSDRVLAYYDIAAGQLHITPIEPYLSAGQSGSLPHYSVDGNFITFVSKEFFSRADFNGDGDQNDTVVRYWDMQVNRAFDTPLVSPYSMVDDGVIATRVVEHQADDINMDGDTDDIVFVTYDIASERIDPYLAVPTFNLSNISTFPVKNGDNYFFREREQRIGYDIDGDGNISSTTFVMQMNLADGSVEWTGISGTSGRIQAAGSYITYDTSEWAVDQDVNGDGNLHNDFLNALRNLADGTDQFFPRTGQISLGENVFSRTQYEGGIGDLSGDGDTTDVIVYAMAIDSSDPIDIHNCDVDDVHCRFLNLIHYLENHSVLTQAMKDLLIPIVEDADSLLLLDGYAHDLERYIMVIDAFDLYFDTIWPQSDIPHEVKMELVEHHPNGRALKDHIHVLKDQAAADLENDEQNDDDGDDAGPMEVQQLIAAIAVSIQSSSAPQATKEAMMVEVSGIIVIAQQVMSGADPGPLMGTLFGHIQALRNGLADPGSGFSVADIDGISAAIDNFEAMLGGN